MATGTWLSVAGEAELVDDRARVEELWDESVASYFDGGKDDPDLALLRVHPESAQYWGVPGSKAVAAVKMLAAKLRGTEGPGVTATADL
jgi:general stress protein 26